ncbi:hypothetical protein HY636_02930 [Candidatus Woesearchaeota archaeon]|nr:hypothetical protein [Candidatus Woesearchaeota archaeon]
MDEQSWKSLKKFERIANLTIAGALGLFLAVVSIKKGYDYFFDDKPTQEESTKSEQKTSEKTLTDLVNQTKLKPIEFEYAGVAYDIYGVKINENEDNNNKGNIVIVNGVIKKSDNNKGYSVRVVMNKRDDLNMYQMNLYSSSIATIVSVYDARTQKAIFIAEDNEDELMGDKRDSKIDSFVYDYDDNAEEPGKQWFNKNDIQRKKKKVCLWTYPPNEEYNVGLECEQAKLKAEEAQKDFEAHVALLEAIRQRYKSTDSSLRK